MPSLVPAPDLPVGVSRILGAGQEPARCLLLAVDSPVLADPGHGSWHRRGPTAPVSQVTHTDPACTALRPLTSHRVQVLAFIGGTNHLYRKTLSMESFSFPNPRACVCDTADLLITLPSVPFRDFL